MPADNQLVSWNDIASFTWLWTSTPQSGTSAIDATDFNTYVDNDGGYPWGYASNQCMSYGDMNAHKRARFSAALSVDVSVNVTCRNEGQGWSCISSTGTETASQSTGSAVSPAGNPHYKITCNPTWSATLVDSSSITIWLTAPGGATVLGPVGASGGELTYLGDGGAGVYTWHFTYDTTNVDNDSSTDWTGQYDVPITGTITWAA